MVCLVRLGGSGETQALKSSEYVLSVRAHEVGACAKGERVAPVGAARARQRAALALPEAAVSEGL